MQISLISLHVSNYFITAAMVKKRKKIVLSIKDKVDILKLTETTSIAIVAADDRKAAGHYMIVTISQQRQNDRVCCPFPASKQEFRRETETKWIWTYDGLEQRSWMSTSQSECMAL